MFRFDKKLKILFCFSLVIMISSLFGLILDPRVITGAPAWLKPFKFSVSFLILVPTLHYFSLHYLDRKSLNTYFSITLGMGLIEQIIIVTQVLRNRPSHFNYTTYFDAVLTIIMGFAIGTFWVFTILIMLKFFKTPQDKKGHVFVCRLSAMAMVVGMGLAWLMTAPNADQLAAARESKSFIGHISGSHAVRIPPDDEQWPLVGWMKRGGDLRVAHFFGMHSAQIIILLFLFFNYFVPSMTAPIRKKVLLATFFVCIGITLALATQALLGHPVFLSHALARQTQQEVTMPEFECTAIEIKDSKITKLLGKKTYPSVSLRTYASGEWQLMSEGYLSRLPENKISKLTNEIEKKVSYEIPHKGTLLKFDLVGTPPSRQGILWEMTPSPLKPRLLARLTCH